MNNFELSLWNHNDQQLVTLRSSINFEGQAYDIKFTQNVNGEENLTFSIPSVVYNKETDNFEDNQIIGYITSTEKILNEQKIRLIKNKKQTNESIHDFVIKNYTESRDGLARIITIECKSYAIFELSRIGYSLKFYEDTLLELTAGEKANLNFWMDRALSYTRNKHDISLNPSGWQFEVYPTKLYETENITGYTYSGGVYNKVVGLPLEKERIISIEKSNVFNVIQELAEKFSVWATFNYEYDESYKVIARKVIFKEAIEQNSSYSISYGVNTKEISKNVDSSELATKVYIEDVESDLENSGLMSLSESPQNLMLEKFLYNFDYYEKAGLISSSDNDWIKTDLAYSIRNKNIDIRNKQIEHANESITYNKLLSDKEFITYEIAGSKELKQELQAKVGQSSASDQIITDSFYIVIDRLTYQYIDLSSRKGIDPGTIVVRDINKINGIYPIIPLTSIKKDSNNPNYADGILLSTSNSKVKVSYSYNLYKYYDSLLTLEELKGPALDNKLLVLTSLVDSSKIILDRLENDIKILLAEKEAIINDFEHRFYFAIKEANWKDDSYKLRKETVELKGITISEDFAISKSYFLSANLNNIDFSSIHIWKVGYSFEYLQTSDYTIEYGRFGNTKGTLIVPTANGAFFNNKLGSLGSTEFINNTSVVIIYKLKNKTEITSIIPSKTSTEISTRFFSIDLNNVLPSTIVLKTTEEENKLIVNTDYTVTTNYNNMVITLKPTMNAKYSPTYSSLVFSKNITSIFYYNDAIEVALRSSTPNVSYSISAVDLSSLAGFEDYVPIPGQKILIKDEEMGFKNVYGFLSQIDWDLDNPENNQLTIANYKTRFEDLFQRIVAATQALNLRSESIDRMLQTLPPTKIINPQILQKSVDENYITLTNSLNNEVSFGPEGITLTDKSETDKVPGQIRIVGNGIFLSNQLGDEGRVWRTGITPSGINASEIKTGVINTGRIIIWDETNPRFVWNSDGLFAYGKNDLGETVFTNYVKYNSEGIIAKKDNQTIFEIDANTGSASFTGSITITGGTGISNLTDAGALASQDTIDLFSNYITGIPQVLTAPSGKGLFLNGNYLGYFENGIWKTYMDKNGNFYLGGNNGALKWENGVLQIGGATQIGNQPVATVVNGASAGATAIQAGNGVSVAVDHKITQISTAGIKIFSGSNPDIGARIVLDNTGLRGYNSNSQTFGLSSVDGSATFSGAITGGTITGSVITGGTIQIASYFSSDHGTKYSFSVVPDGNKVKTNIRYLSVYPTNRNEDSMDVEGKAHFNDAVYCAYVAPEPGNNNPAVGFLDNFWSEAYINSYYLDTGLISRSKIYYDGKPGMTVDNAKAVPWTGITGKPTFPTGGSYNHSGTLTAAAVYNNINVTNGLVTNIGTRNLTAANIGAAKSDHTHVYAGAILEGGTANDAYKLRTARRITLSGYAGNGSALFDGSQNITINTSYSDERIKENIEDLPQNAVDLILNLNPIKFKYKDEYSRSRRDHWGFTAQHIKQKMSEVGIDDCALYVDPEINHLWEDDDIKEINQFHPKHYVGMELTAPMIKIIQILNKKVISLEERINFLENKNGII